MVPAWEASSFEVVETELALEILVDALRAPPLHHDSYELSLCQSFGQSGQTRAASIDGLPSTQRAWKPISGSESIQGASAMGIRQG